MAKLLKYWSLVICMLLLLKLADVAECRVASMVNLHRKYYFLMEKKYSEMHGFKVKGAPRLENNIGKNKENMRTEDWELRRVPAGPDPLHHNGQNPNKPRNTP